MKDTYTVLKTKVVTLIDGATVAVDASKGNCFRLASSVGRTISAPTNGYDGQKITLIFKNTHGSNNITHGLSSGFRYLHLMPQIPLILAGNLQILEAIYHEADNAWDVAFVSNCIGVEEAYVGNKIVFTKNNGASEFFYDTTGNRYAFWDESAGNGSGWHAFFKFSVITNNREYTYPNKSGTVALLTDIATLKIATTDDTRTSVTLTDDAELAVTLAVGWYDFTAKIFVDDNDIDLVGWLFDFGGTATLDVVQCLYTKNDNGNNSETRSLITDLSTDRAVLPTNSTPYFIEIKGSIHCSSAGTLVFRWATNEPGASIVRKAGSSLLLIPA